MLFNPDSDHCYFLQTNNYQAILITNNLDTYVLYVYTCGEMQWSSLGQSRAAVVGYNAEGNFFQNHPSSGFSTIADAISCGSPQRRRRKRQNDQDPRIPTRFPTDRELRMRAERCIRRFLREINLFRINPTDLASAVADYPCPPKLDQAITDAARYVPHTILPLCFVSSVSRRSDLSQAITVSATQQSCYDDITG